jgi:hypothetical protein
VDLVVLVPVVLVDQALVAQVVRVVLVVLVLVVLVAVSVVLVLVVLAADLVVLVVPVAVVLVADLVVAAMVNVVRQRRSLVLVVVKTSMKCCHRQLRRTHRATHRFLKVLSLSNVVLRRKSLHRS